MLLASATTEIKKSKFISLAYSVDTTDEVKTIISALKKEHPKAKHIVYAYKLTNTAGKTDDKEPAGSAGSQIYNLIALNDLTNILVIVIRYYGGTKLGLGLLSRTYKEAALTVLKKGKVIS